MNSSMNASSNGSSNRIPNLNLELAHFTGSESYYRHMISRLYYTEGVQYMAQTYGCYWLLDKILIEAALNKNLLKEDFQVWKLIWLRGDVFELHCSDGNDRELFKEIIPFSDFVADHLTLWFSDGVLLLPSEY
ncbi:hypothetical protein QNI19_32195 [Cytophagaceae bacterium DM2B3-1]|uniref:DUF6876 domain-containing protein n=1 Tax=Xanthocytophaga flava TaxID=3048013 RepID=A0ABT7CXF6_9BACT|nr:DUF6876 family protein [Xanthocytophaga flavus]MDJ1497645.1 hypothetical protein [Xanthocytophaga flavus]